MRGRRGFFSLFTSLPEHIEEKNDAKFSNRRRRRYSSGDRETWSRKVEYFFASLGYAVGLGNIWRFPYLCYRNGGGAFLIPYLLALAVGGFPILFMEMAFGQFASLGTITIWRICPLFKGLGYCIVVILILVNTYYNVLVAYALFYLFASITNELPWASCDNKWNTKNCISLRDQSARHVNMTNLTTVASALSPLVDKKLLRTPTEEYFERHLLNISGGIGEVGDVKWTLIVCLAVSWFVCFACLFKGIKSMGKAAIFTTAFSYIILTVLLIRGITLPGASQGLIYYLKPDFTKLNQPQVWGEAASQAFASLSLGAGGWITLSSYNKFSNRCNRDAILVGIGNALTSIYAGLVIFSVLGYMAHVKGIDRIDDVTKEGPGLAFVVYPEGLSLIPGAPFWSICFFFMMFTVGLDSLFGQVETIAAGIIDEYPDFLRPRRKLFTLFLCLFMFLLGVPLSTRAGIYIVTMMDWYTLLFSLSITSLFEIIVIIYIYGHEKFSKDIEIMVGHKPGIFYLVCWRFATPILIFIVIVFLGVNYRPPNYGHYTLPPWAETLGLVLGLLPVTLIPIVMIYQIIKKAGIVCPPWKLCTDNDLRKEIESTLVRPHCDWGPALPEIRRKFSYGPRTDEIEEMEGMNDDSRKVQIDPEPHEIPELKDIEQKEETTSA